ncbi:galactokinase [Nocardioides marinquilinus]|uniref:Galactokinase n=1 Tax=Nocardioides marinquilinus TaxID=1210400 RepID=A0ABP9PSS3_9ACTN
MTGAVEPGDGGTTVEARAPGRVNLIGEHTDYNAGLCLPIAIPAETRATARVLADGPTRLSSAQQDDVWSGRPAEAGPGAVGGWAAYAAGTLWALEQAGVALPALDLHLDSSVPLGAGLSSSASLEAAVAVAACAAAGLEVDDALRRDVLLPACRRAESEVVGAPTGGLDQSAVLLAGEGRALLLDFATDETPLADPVDFDVAAAGLALLVIDTRVSHSHADGGYGSRRDECAAAARALGVATLRETDAVAVAGLDDALLRRRAGHVVTENARVVAAVTALASGDWAGLGRLLDASHESLRHDFEVSCVELDVAVETAREAGALGARMTGGGFGGSAIALVPAERVDAVRRAVDAAFVRAGFAAPGHLDGTPSAPAGLLRSS